jgi:hypothetical protein
MTGLIFANPRFDALRNAIYHTERRNFFDLVNRSLNFLVVLLGAGVAAKVASHTNFSEYWLELGVVFFATAQLVFDFGSRARTHEFLQKRYYEILSEMDAEGAHSADNIKKWSAKLCLISADEPLPMRALDALAYNKATDATTGDLKKAMAARLYVPWHHRRLRHFFAFQAAEYLPLDLHRSWLVRCANRWQQIGRRT